jgi:hypothetical protein
MKKLLSGVKRALSPYPSSRGSGSHSGDNGSQDSLMSSSGQGSGSRSGVKWSEASALFLPIQSSRYLAHDDIPEAMNSLHRRG